MSDTTDLIGFFTHNPLQRTVPKKQKYNKAADLWGMARLVRDDRKERVTQIVSRYNQGMQKTISERLTHRTVNQMGFRGPH